jgi:rSAM/selenodomain-associated transferase 2
MRISIVVPTLNEERALPSTLQNIAECAQGCEVIIVDGGSVDRTLEIAAQFNGVPLVVLKSERGRGNQMNAGAAASTGDVLLFLHADTLLPPNTPALIAEAMMRPGTIGGFFRIAFVPRSPLADFYAFCYNLRSHWRTFYGDAGLFVGRETFENMGGYQASLLMEDIELIRRLRRSGRLAYVRGGTVRTSARRFASPWAGVKMLGVWMWLHVLHAFGVSQEKLARRYPDER